MKALAAGAFIMTFTALIASARFRMPARLPKPQGALSYALLIAVRNPVCPIFK